MLDIIPIDEWAQANEVTDPVQKYKKYNTYVKSQVLQSDDVSDEERDSIFSRINQRTLEGLKAEGKTDEDIQNAFAPEPLSFDRKLETVYRSLDAVDDDEAASTIRDYYSSRKFAAAPDAAQEFVQKVEAQKPLVEQYVADHYDEAVQSQILNNDIPFARVELPDGQVALVAGPSAVGLKPYDAYRKSLAAGTIREEDLDGVIDSMRKDSNGYELFRHKNFEEAQDYVNSAQKTDPNLQYQIAQAEQEIADTGQVSDDTHTQFRALMFSHNPNLARQYDAEDLRAVLDYTAGSQAMVAGIVEYDDENAANNVRKFGYGYTTLHRDTILNNEKYAEATKGLPEDEKRVLDGQRALLREAQFDQFNKSLSRSYLGEEWQSFLQAGLAEGKDRADILDEFTNSDAYSGAANIAQHIGLSIGEAITDIGWGIGTVAGSDTARQNLIENYRDRQARADVAELFGQGFGMGVELSSMVAPVIADMAATAGLSVLTGVAGGAVAFGGAAAKRGIVKTLKNSILKEAVDQAEGAAIRTAMTTGSRATVAPAMKSFAEHYAKIVGSKATTASSLFIPAAARSGSMTYAAVYDALERSPEGQNLTPEERHDKALAAGATAGMVTGIITTAFSFGGRGGLEDFVLRRATGKDIRKVMDGLAGRTLSNEAYNGVLKALLADGAKQFARRAAGKEIIKGFTDEALEEGFDEYLNTIIQAVATNEDLAFMDVAHSTMMGALYGGVFGAAVGPARKGFQTLMDVVTPADPIAAMQREAEVKRSIALVSANRLIRDKANSLKQADLPQTAREFERQMQEAITARADDVAQAPAAEQPAAEQPAAEQSAATELEDILSPDELATIDEEAAAAAEQPAAVEPAAVEPAAVEPAAVEPAAVEPAAVEPNSLEEAVQKRKAKEAATLEPNISADQSKSLEQQLDDFLRQDIDDQFTPEDDVVTPEEDTAELIKKVLASSTADIEDNVDKVTKAKPEASKVKEIPVDSPEVLKAKAEERIAELIEIGIPLTLASGRYGLPKLGSGSGDYWKQKTAEMAKAIAERQKDKDSRYYVPTRDQILKWNGVEEVRELKQPKGATAPLLASLEGGVLFTNDPVVISHALNKMKRPFVVIPASYEGPVSPAFEVVSEGRVRKVVDVKKATIGKRNDKRVGVKNAAKKAELANAVDITQEADFYQAGLFRGDETEKKFILDGPMTVADALKSFNGWIVANQNRIVAGKGQVGGAFAARSDLSNMKGLKDKEGMLSEILYEFIFDIHSQISIAPLRKLVEPYMVNGEIVEDKLDELIESMTSEAGIKRGSFYMNVVDKTLTSLRENEGLNVGRTTYKGADLSKQAETQPQKLAAFFYYLLSGRSSITGESTIFSQQQLVEDGIITDPKKSRNRSSVKKGWEKKIIKKALEEIYKHPEFSKQEGRPFPDFPKAIGSASNRIKQRLRGTGQLRQDRLESSIQEMGERQQEQVGLADEELQAGAADEGGVDFAQDEDLSFDEVDQSDDPMKKASNYAFILHNFRNKTAFYLSGLSGADRQSAEKAIYDFAGAVFGTTADEIKSSGQYDLSGTNSVVSELLHRIQSRPVKPELQAYFNSVYETLPPPLRSAAAIMGLDVPVRLSFEKAEALFHQRVAVREQFTQRAPNESADVEANRAKNNEDILRLGLVDGDAATVTVALQKISRSGVDESHKAVAKLLLREVSRFNNVQFRIVDNANTNYAGLFTAEPDGTRRVTLNIAATYGSGVESVLLHEYLHAATHDLLRSDNLTSKQQTALRRLEALRSEVAAEYGTSGSSQITMDNGLSNIDEFISSLFTSPAFQENVRALPKRGFVQRILDAVRDLFGVPKKSVLARAFDDLVDFLNMEVSPAPAGFDAVEQRVRRNRASENTREKLIVDSYLNENVGQLRFTSIESRSPTTLLDNDFFADIESGDRGNDNLREAIQQAPPEQRQAVVTEWLERNPQTAEKLRKATKDKTEQTMENPTLAFHGSLEKDITTFRTPLFVGNLQNANNYAVEYTREGTLKGRTYPLFVDLKKNLNLFEYNGWVDLVTKLDEQGLDTSELKDAIVLSAYPDEFGQEATETAPKGDARSDSKRTWENYVKQNSKPKGFAWDIDGNNLSATYREDGSAFMAKDNSRIVEAIRNLGFDSATQPEGGYTLEEGSSTIVFSPEQIKSADPITFDDNGNIIPPSKRFNRSSPDIRFTSIESRSRTTLLDNDFFADIESGDRGNDNLREALQKAPLEQRQAVLDAWLGRNYRTSSKLKEMVKGLAKAAGYILEAVHGGQHGIDAFDAERIKNQDAGAGFYFSTDVRSGHAEGYAERIGGKVYEVFLRHSNPYYPEAAYTNTPVKDPKIFKQTMDSLQKLYGLSDKDIQIISDFVDYPINLLTASNEFAYQLLLLQDSPKFSELSSKAQTAVITTTKTLRGEQGMQSLLDTIALLTKHDGIIYRDGSVATVLNPAQIKSSAPITLDANGNIIPLSQRFDRSSPDIRFTSIENIESDDELTDTQREAIDQLIDETIKQVVPADVPVYEVTDPEASTFKSRPNALFASRVVNVNGRNVASIIINRPAAQAALTEMHGEVVDSIHVKQLLEAVLNEEIFHVAELRSISRAEIDELANELSQYDLEEAIDAYTQDAVFANELKAAVQEGDANVIRQVVGELLRMKAQRLTRGYTTEEDRAFYYSSPKFHRVMFRYVVGLFKRMAAAYNLRKDNAEMARMVNRLAREASVLRSGVLRIQQRLQFDALAPNMAENELSALFSATLEKGKPIEITADMTIEDIIKRMPMFAEVEISIGSFDQSGYKENSWIAKTLNGELDPRVLELFKQSDAVKRSIPARAASLYQEIVKAIQSSPELDYELIGDYLGRPDDTEVPIEFYNYRKDVFQTAYENRTLSQSEREQLYIEMVDEPVAIEKSRLVSVAKKKKKIAEQKLLNNHRDLYDKMAELRMILDGLSVVMRDKFDTSGELRMAIDRNLGIYVTRAYRAFNEEGYMDKLIHFIEQDKGTITDKVMLQRYNQVYALFEDSYINNYAYGIVKAKDEKDQPTSSRMSLDEARAFGKATLEERRRNGSDPIQEAILEYLYSLDPNSRFTSGKIASSVAKSVVDQIRKRENVPEPIRELLGQYDDADVVDNILRSITALTRAVSRESFIHNLITLGTKSGFVVPLKEAQRRLNLGDTSVRGFVNLRNGARIASSDIENETLADSVENDFTKSLYFYIDPAAYAALKKHMAFQSPADLSSDKKMIEDILTGYRRLIGGSLAAKTLGSFGFYLRNIMGNLVFFAPMQGVNPAKMTKHIGRVVTALKTPKAVDDYTAELMSYNVVQGDVRTQFAKELMSGRVTLDSLRGEIAETDSKIKKLQKAGKTAGEKIKPLTDRLFALSDAVDTFFKIGVYEHELDVLRKAQQHEIKAGISDGEFFGLTEHDLKKMASVTTRNTTQSYVDAYEFVKYATSKYSYLLPPFLRFRMDILRLLFDGTPKQIKKEISSNNPIIKSRGYKRLGGFISVVGGFSIGAPLALRAIFGFGDEEDELIREGQLPDYQRNSTLFYFGDFVAVFTFLNPISGGGPDSVLRAFEDMMRGNPSEGIMRAIKMIASEYAGEQILLQAANDVMQNKDSRTGDPIYEEDEGVSALFKMFGYLFKEAYSPRTPEAVLKAAITAAGDESQDPLRSSAGIIIRELMPIRPTAVDIPRAYQQALAKQRDKRNRLSSKLNRLRSRGSLTEGEIEELARDFVEDRKRIDRDIARYTKAALSKGMTVAEVQNSMKYYRMSGDRIKDILYRRFKRPEISEALIRDLQSMGPVGVERLQRVQQVIGQYSRYEAL